MDTRVIRMPPPTPNDPARTPETRPIATPIAMSTQVMAEGMR